MAFAYTITRRTVIGNMRMVCGTFSNATSDTGGTIATGLNRVEYFSVQATGTAVVSNAPVVNATFPTSTGNITIVTDADVDGVWMAIGR